MTSTKEKYVSQDNRFSKLNKIVELNNSQNTSIIDDKFEHTEENQQIFEIKRKITRKTINTNGNSNKKNSFKFILMKRFL